MILQIVDPTHQQRIDCWWSTLSLKKEIKYALNTLTMQWVPYQSLHTEQFSNSWSLMSLKQWMHRSLGLQPLDLYKYKDLSRVCLICMTLKEIPSNLLKSITKSSVGEMS